MQRASRNVDMEPRLDALRRRHAEYEEELQRFAKRHYLSPEEEAHVRKLKVMKLHAREEIDAIGGGGARA